MGVREGIHSLVTMRWYDRCCDREHTGETADLGLGGLGGGHRNLPKTVMSKLQPRLGENMDSVPWG